MNDEEYLGFIIICFAIGFSLGILKTQLFNNPYQASFKFQVEVNYK
jgi:hypothetical protein